MSVNDSRYVSVDATLPEILPAISRDEAMRAYRKIVKHFGGVEYGGPQQTQPVRVYRSDARRCWIALKSTRGHHKGWGRLVHDASHTIFSRRHPNFRPHAGGHAKLEREIAEYVVAQGWLAGTLKQKAAPKLSTQERRAARFVRHQELINRWESKRRRAEAAIKRLKARQRAIVRAIDREQQKI